MDLSNITQGTHCYQIFDIPLNKKVKMERYWKFLRLTFQNAMKYFVTVAVT